VVVLVGLGVRVPLELELEGLLLEDSWSSITVLESESGTIMKSAPRSPPPRLFFRRILVDVFLRELLPLDLIDPPRLLDIIVKVVAADALLVETEIEFLSVLNDPFLPTISPVVVVLVNDDENGLPLAVEIGLE